MFHKIRFEANRIFGNKIIILCMSIFLFLSIYVIYGGIIKHKDVQKRKEAFINFERNKVSKYVNYDQYGGYGFLVYFDPSNLNIFFNNNNVYDNLFSNIDMTEIIEINASFKGKKIFTKRGYLKDFSDLFYILGSLFMVFAGMLSYKSEKHFFMFGNILIRLGILIISILLLTLIPFNLPGVLGIKLDQIRELVGFTLYLIFYLSFFYSVGLFIRIVSKKRLTAIISILLFWFLLVFGIPDIIDSYSEKISQSIPENEIINMGKLSEVMNFENEVRRAVKGVKTIKERDEIYKNMAERFFNTGYMKNKEVEYDINNKVNTIIEKIENLSLIFPTSFFKFNCGEVSSKGYIGYIRFVSYVLNLRHNFVVFYLKKKYESDDTEVEPFVKNNENIFQAKSHLPKSFWKGTSLTALYTIILFTISFFILKRRLDKKKETLKPDITPDEGHMYYLRCKDQHYMDMIYHHYENQPHTACLDQVNGRDIDPGVSLPHMISYFCKLLGANKERTLENLEKLGITDLEKEKRTPETIKKIYCAVSLAVECDIAVIKNFIYREPREFERQFLGLLKYMMEQDTIIIYLGTEPPQAYSPLKSDSEVDKYQEFKIDDPLLFILR